MEDQIDRTLTTRIEHGFNICNYNGDLIDKDECTGDICEIKLKKECSNQNINPKVGDYHTHPRGNPKMSLADIKTACRLDFKCIGSIDNSIRCFTKKTVPSSKGCSLEIENIINETEEISKETDLLKRERSILDKLKKLPNLDVKKYNKINNEHDIKIRHHNDSVSYLIERKNLLIDTYFKEIIVK